MALHISLSRDSYTFSQLAGELVQCSTEALRTRAWRARRAGHPHPLPTPTRLPGGGEIYMRRDVEQWLATLRGPEIEVHSGVHRRPGRPKKIDSMLRGGVSK